MVYRIYVEKRRELAHEANALHSELKNLLGISALTSVRILNRYDVENITPELFGEAVRSVFSEPQLDITTPELPQKAGEAVFATEYLPGQFDQRADSAAQCIQIISQGERPIIRTAKVYLLGGELTDADLAQIKKYVINPVEAREAALELPETLTVKYDIPTEVATLEGFLELDRAGLERFVRDYGLAMDADDIAFCQDYFKTEKRNPTITEIRMIDTYWSDHCRHTTFNTTIDSVKFEDDLLQETYDDYLATRRELGRTKPINLMDIGTLAAKALKKAGKLTKLDESEEINACSVNIKAKIDELFARIEEFGKTCKDYADFETQFASSPLNQEYINLFTEVATTSKSKMQPVDDTPKDTRSDAEILADEALDDARFAVKEATSPLRHQAYEASTQALRSTKVGNALFNINNHIGTVVGVRKNLKDLKEAEKQRKQGKDE